MVAEKFQIYSFKTTANWLVKKLNLFSFIQLPTNAFPQVFVFIPQADGNCLFPPNNIFWRYCLFSLVFFHRAFFPEQKEGGEDYVVKFTKINKGIGHKFW